MTLLALVLLLLLLCAPAPAGARVASEKCVVTYETWVAGQKVLDRGRYCVPWV